MGATQLEVLAFYLRISIHKCLFQYIYMCPHIHYIYIDMFVECLLDTYVHWVWNLEP